MESRHRWSRPAGLAGAFALSCSLLVPTLSAAQNATPSRPDTPAPPPADQPPRFFDALTVSATLTPTPVKDTPGTVSVIDADTIERRLIENVADLVKFEPGVYIDANLTRGGLNGFNIRGIGGNRVMTQVDGVETSEQFDFQPFNHTSNDSSSRYVHQNALDLDTLKRPGRAQRKRVDLRQRCTERDDLVLHQGWRDRATRRGLRDAADSESGVGAHRLGTGEALWSRSGCFPRPWRRPHDPGRVSWCSSTKGGLGALDASAERVLCVSHETTADFSSPLVVGGVANR